jgi:hypothetical protein
MRYNTKNKKHLDALHALEKCESYIIECEKVDFDGLMQLARRKSLLDLGMVIGCSSYVAIPPSMVQDHIYILKFTRKA